MHSHYNLIITPGRIYDVTQRVFPQKVSTLCGHYLSGSCVSRVVTGNEWTQRSRWLKHSPSMVEMWVKVSPGPNFSQLKTGINRERERERERERKDTSMHSHYNIN